MDLTQFKEVRAMAKSRVIGLLMGVVMLFVGIPISKSLGIEKPRPTGDNLALGKKVYSEKCVICHGEKGDGKGEFAYLIYPAPRDFSSALFKIRSTPSGSLPTDDDLFRIVSEGMRGTAMFPFKDELSERERWGVVYFIKTFSEKWKNYTPGKPVSIGEPPPKTEELLVLGKKMYEDVECGKCHGEKGKGDGPSSDTLKDDAGNPIFPYDFTTGKMKGGYETREIVRTFLTGMAGTPMPAYEGILDEKEQWALAYYVQSLSGRKLAPKTVGYQIIAQRHKGALPMDPMDRAWGKVKAGEMPVQLLWAWTKKKAIETVQLRSLFNEDEIAVLVEWDDPSNNNSLDLKVDKFIDAVAIQFMPSKSGDGRAFFGMGDEKHAVNTWYWRADSWVPQGKDVAFKKNPLSWASKEHYPPHPLQIPVKEPISPVQDLNAAKPGTSTYQPQDSQNVKGKGVWTDGKWRVLFRRALKTADPKDMQFSMGGRYPIAFAVWDGDLEGANGKKAITPWQIIELKSRR